jgi:hypothetical protein
MPMVQKYNWHTFGNASNVLEKVFEKSNLHTVNNYNADWAK